MTDFEWNEWWEPHEETFVLAYDEYLDELSAMRSSKFPGQHKICYGRKENMIIKSEQITN